ncbi:MAG: hypothetical protein J0M08_06845 [Bacteroidetes bacterium]|nr:hypothetical protein [Bacteroidota bacterium]
MSTKKSKFLFNDNFDKISDKIEKEVEVRKGNPDDDHFKVDIEKRIDTLVQKEKKKASAKKPIPNGEERGRNRYQAIAKELIPEKFIGTGETGTLPVYNELLTKLKILSTLKNTSMRDLGSLALYELLKKEKFVD